MVMPECVDDRELEADGGAVTDADAEELLPELDAGALPDDAART
jgi:hypothetical protein